MKKSNWLTISLALALTGVMAWTGPVWAQPGPGGGPRGQGNQLRTGGGPGAGPWSGTCQVNPPGNPSCPMYGSGTTQTPRGRQGMRGRGRAIQPDPQATPPAVTK
jgi:hypothetical protein